MSDRDFAVIRSTVLAHAGLSLTTAKREMVYARLARRLRALRCAKFSDYLDRLRDPAENEVERLVGVLTTKVTSFFREPEHFECLAEHVLPERIAARERSMKLRIWSAGCASGEEAYSLAIVLRETLEARSSWDALVLATDIDRDALVRAESGVYALEDVRHVSPERLRFFQRGRGRYQGQVRVKPELRERIRFRPLNLIAPWPFRHAMDVIFFRNVAIYLAPDVQQQLFERFAQVLAPGGYLFIGSSETLGALSVGLRRVRHSVFRKVAADRGA